MNLHRTYSLYIILIITSHVKNLIIVFTVVGVYRQPLIHRLQSHEP